MLSLNDIERSQRYVARQKMLENPPVPRKTKRTKKPEAKPLQGVIDQFPGEEPTQDPVPAPEEPPSLPVLQQISKSLSVVCQSQHEDLARLAKFNGN